MLSNYSLYVLRISTYNFTILTRIVVPLLGIRTNSLLIISTLNWNLSNNLVLAVDSTLVDHSLLLDIWLSWFDSGFYTQRFKISGLNCLSVVRLRNSWVVLSGCISTILSRDKSNCSVVVNSGLAAWYYFSTISRCSIDVICRRIVLRNINVSNVCCVPSNVEAFLSSSDYDFLLTHLV